MNAFQENAFNTMKLPKMNQTATNKAEPIEEIRTEEEVRKFVDSKKQEMLDGQKPIPTKRGRKPKYSDGNRPDKLSFVVNKELASKVRKVARKKGKTVILLVEPYLKEWISDPVELDNPYALSEKSSNGIYLDTELKEQFVGVTGELGFKQSYVIESIYNKIVEENGEE